MSTYTQILYQIVFSTFDQKETLVISDPNRLFRYISGILQKKKCHLYIIGGVEDHIHIITHVHPMIAPAMLIKDIKLASTEFISSENIFPAFSGWQIACLPSGRAMVLLHIRFQRSLILSNMFKTRQNIIKSSVSGKNISRC